MGIRDSGQGGLESKSWAGEKEGVLVTPVLFMESRLLLAHLRISKRAKSRPLLLTVKA